MDKLVKLSEHESKFYGLRVGRLDRVDFEPESLVQSIFDLRLDLCKLKVDLSNPRAFDRLRNLGFHYSYHSLLLRQVIDLRKESDRNVRRPEGFHFKEYARQDEGTLRAMVDEVLTNDVANLYYTDRLFDGIIDRIKFKEAVTHYQTTFDSSVDATKLGYLAFYEGRPIGFCTLQIAGRAGIGIFVGILPEHRGEQLFREFVRWEMLQSKLMGCDTFVCDTIAFNTRSLNTTFKEGLRIESGLMNVNIICLLSRSEHMFDLTASPADLLTVLAGRLSAFGTIVDFRFLPQSAGNGPRRWRVLFDRAASYCTFSDASHRELGYARLLCR